MVVKIGQTNTEQCNEPVITTNDYGLAAGRSDGRCEFAFILIRSVVKVLHDTPVSAKCYNALVTARGHYGITGPGKRVGRAGVHTDLTLKG